MNDYNTTPGDSLSIATSPNFQSRAGSEGIISIVTLERVGDSAWDEFINCTEGSLPTQTAAWESILQKSYGFSCYYLAAQQEGQLQGVLPLFRVKSFLTGDSLQSMAGALCASSEQAADVLIRAADDLARQLGVDYLLLRDSRQLWSASGLDAIEAHRGVRLHIPADSETAWKNLHRNLRYDIRNGTRKGNVDVVLDHSLLDDFYEIMLRFNHQMGTPLFSKQFISDVVRSFPGRVSIAMGFHSGKPVAGYFNLIHRNQVIGIWGSTLHPYTYMMPTHRVYWKIIKNAIHLGYDKWDLGRSIFPSTQYDFKAKWGDETYPIYQLFRIYRGKTPPTLNIIQAIHENKQVSLFSHLWLKLPLPLARSLGPIVRRHMPFG